MEKFFDRKEAGKFLANQLQAYANHVDTIVLALPRGGVPVAFEIAKFLHLPLDVFIVRKLGVPGHEELAMGAIASGGTIVFNEDILQEIAIPETSLNYVIENERQELKRREIAYRGHKPFPDLTGKTIILVDDGIATGATMRAAVQALKKQNPAHIIIAVPAAALTTCEEMKNLVDDIVCPIQPYHFYAVGAWYENFAQTSDQEVSELLSAIK